ncbi:hypothetical protein PQX77_022413 [Marasmius sp. AFHP31]|nr:hypothetical protein PQX77_022413 [Marasmius sp. AFHP31]
MDERRNIALACRFIPYDQWLVTHVDTTWTISQLKSWFIAKCIATSGSSNFSASSLSLAFPFLHVPAKPRSKPPRRPTSPIVFAPEPKGRAISPIRFAPLGPPNPSSSDVGLGGSSEEEGTTIAMGYEEDDEFGNLDSDTELSFSGKAGGGGGRGKLGRATYLSHLDNRPNTARSVAIEQSQDSTKSHHGHQQQPVLERQLHHQQQRHHHHSRSSGGAAVPHHSTYDIRRLMLIRFSTGQVLEDHYRVDDCSLSPYELIEIHRVGEVLSLPRTIIEQYVQPYWEGWVKSLRVVARQPAHPSSSKKQKGKRLEKERENEDGSGAANRQRRSKLDWRDRWVFVKDGVLNLRKDRLNPNTAQLLPLDSLIEIRGSEQIGRSFTATSGNPVSQQRIICAKFRSRTSSTRFADPPDPANLEEPQYPPSKLSSPFNGTHNVSSSSKGKAKISASAWLAAYDPSAFVQPPLPSTHPASSIHTKASKHSLHSLHVPPKHSSSSGTLVSTSSSKPKIKLDINHNTSTGSVDVRDDELVAWPPAKGKGKGKEKERVKGKEKAKEKRRVREKEKEKEDRVHSDDGHAAVDEARTRPGPSRSSTDDEREREPVPDAKDHLELHTHPDLNILSDDNTNTNNNGSKDNQDTTDSDSGSLSSPVFAHSDVDSDADVPEVGVGGYGWGYSYGYGFDRGAAVRKRKEKEGQQRNAVCAPHASLGRAGSGGKDSERDERVETAGVDEVMSPSVATSATVVARNDEDDPGGAGDSSFVVIDANTVDDRERESQSRKSAKKEKSKGTYSYEERPTTAATVSTIRGHNSRPGTGTGAHTRPHHQKASDSEWIVLDLGDDHAYKSFLRILHRHAPHSIFSSFVQSLSLSLPAIPSLPPASPTTPNPTPIGDGTPSPSPIVFAPAPADPRNRHRHQTSHSYEIAAIGNGSADGDEHDEHTHPHPPHSHDDSAVTTPRESEIFPMPNSEGTKLLNTFGALPYPEWRVELVTRARKSGMGGVNKAMEMFLWGGGLGLVSGSEAGLGVGVGMGARRTSSILSTGTGSLSGGGASEDPGDEEESLRRKRKKKAEMRKTLERENIAIGLERTESGSSVISNGGRSSVKGKKKSRMSSSTVVDGPGDGEGQESFYSADEGDGDGGNETDSTNSNSLQGLNGVDSDDSGEESSDAEWTGWMADLYRQTVVHKESKRKKLEEENAKVVESLRHQQYHRTESDEQSSYMGWLQEDDYRLAQRERMALEPSGRVVGPELLPAAPVRVASPPYHGHYTHPHTPALSSTNTDDSTSYPSHTYSHPPRLSSPSSNESLGRVRGRRLSFGMSPLSDVYPSSSTSATTNTATVSTAATSPPPPQSASPRSQGHGHSRTSSQRLVGAIGLSHFASSGVIGAEFREREFGSVSARRPSMPTLNSGSVYASGSDGPSVSSPQPFGRDRTTTPPSGVSAVASEQTPTEKMGRRSSLTMGLGAGSLGRSSSRLRKKERGDGEGEKEREKEKLKKEKAKAKEREKEEKERERERKGKGKEKEKEKDEERAQIMSTGSIGIGGRRRPRLSLSTGSRQTLNVTSGFPQFPHPQSPPQSPPPPSRNIVRRMRSSSSLMMSAGENNGDGAGPSAGGPVRHVSNPNPTTIRKKPTFVREVSKRAEKLVQGIENALDFVDSEKPHKGSGKP